MAILYKGIVSYPSLGIPLLPPPSQSCTSNVFSNDGYTTINTTARTEEREIARV
jgi:hypothetical protein